MVPGFSPSTLCPGCGTSINLRDYEFRRPSGMAIETRGNVVVTKTGSADGVRLCCHNLDVRGGRIAGRIECSGDFNFEGDSSVTGGIWCKNLHVAPNSSLRSIHPIVAESALIDGTTTADIECSGTIVIGPKGLLQGNVIARAFKIVPGGSLEGSTQIVNVMPPPAPLATPEGGSEAGEGADGDNSPRWSRFRRCSRRKEKPETRRPKSEKEPPPKPEETGEPEKKEPGPKSEAKGLSKHDPPPELWSREPEPEE